MMAEISDNQEHQRLRDQYAEIASLAGGLAHEIRNPLSTIVMNLDLLAEDLEEEDSPRANRMTTKIQTVQRECRHLEEILNDFLQFARAGELDLVDVDLNVLVSDFIDFYQPQAQGKKIDVSPHLGIDLPLIRIDLQLMRQVLMNLVHNAEHAMPDGGLLEFQTFHRDDKVHLELIDNGCGMNERTLGKMFRTFYSTKSQGSGLGLPTVRKIVLAHGGHIACDSEPGRGTRFTISFPVSREA